MNKDLVPMPGLTVLFCPAGITVASWMFLSPFQLKLKLLRAKAMFQGSLNHSKLGDSLEGLTRHANKFY